jgi:hypothetical protein
MPVNPTYVPIASQVLASAQSNIVFSNISPDYTDLVVHASGKGTGSGVQFNIYVNGDTGNNYSSSYLWDDGGSAGRGSRDVNRNHMDISGVFDGTTSDANSFGPIQIHFNNYASNYNYKTAIAQSIMSSSAGAGIDYVNFYTSTWYNTAPITSLTFYNNSSNLAAGTTVTLYGIKEANPVNTNYSPKASGGQITTDNTYWYHTFLYTGTFTPNSTLSCDILVIAGGGGGGTGGGGAGGVLGFASQSVSTAQTVTVGAGGGYMGSAGNNPSPTNGGNSQFGSLTAAVGGGSGGVFSSPGASGGSGGGGSVTSGGSAFAGGTATSGQGTAGGSGTTSSNASAGGGGGAGTAGSDGNGYTGGNGGEGTNSVTNYGSLAQTLAITGTGNNGVIAGGGGGGYDFRFKSYNGSQGGSGGGGLGASIGTYNGYSGVGGTGSGGGGGNVTSGSTYMYSGNGGSGIVIVRYGV